MPVITLCLTHFETNNSRSFKAQLYFEIIKERWVKGLTCFMWWCWQCDCYLKENKAWSRFGSFLVSNLWWTFFIDLKNMIYYWGFQGNMKHRNTLKQDFLIFKNSQLLLLTIKNLFTHTHTRARVELPGRCSPSLGMNAVFCVLLPVKILGGFLYFVLRKWQVFFTISKY